MKVFEDQIRSFCTCRLDLQRLNLDMVDILLTILPNDPEVSCFVRFLGCKGKCMACKNLSTSKWVSSLEAIVLNIQLTRQYLFPFLFLSWIHSFCLHAKYYHCWCAMTVCLINGHSIQSLSSSSVRYAAVQEHFGHDLLEDG